MLGPKFKVCKKFISVAALCATSVISMGASSCDGQTKTSYNAATIVRLCYEFKDTQGNPMPGSADVMLSFSYDYQSTEAVHYSDTGETSLQTLRKTYDAAYGTYADDLGYGCLDFPVTPAIQFTQVNEPYDAFDPHLKLVKLQGSSSGAQNQDINGAIVDPAPHEIKGEQGHIYRVNVRFDYANPNPSNSEALAMYAKHLLKMAMKKAGTQTSAIDHDSSVSKLISGSEGGAGSGRAIERKVAL